MDTTDRGSGILLHLTSLPGPKGVGTMGRCAYEFVDFLKSSGQKYWQVLPLNQTGYGDSPYQAISLYAGNHYLVDLDMMAEEGMIDRSEIESADLGCSPDFVDYEKLFLNKTRPMKIAFINSYDRLRGKIAIFREENRDWVEDYALYMVLKQENGFGPYYGWNNKVKNRDKDVVEHLNIKYEEDKLFWIFVQYVFYSQWKSLKRYANENGITIIGDIPIYAARDSVDVWSNPEVFMLDKHLEPILLSGCPPDGFCHDGQLWGNPVYNWSYLELTGFKWWMKRIGHNLEMYDMVRFDHFRGFESFWAITAESETARYGSWIKGPGYSLFKKIEDSFGNIPGIAEDLGFITKEVMDLKSSTGYPGMKILQFAFDGDKGNQFLPYNYGSNSVVYTGTHDNATIMEWRDSLGEEELSLVSDYINMRPGDEFNWEMIRMAMSSVARIAIFPMQDVLGLENEGRLNTPGASNGNWAWRLKDGTLTQDLSKKLHKMTTLYGR